MLSVFPKKSHDRASELALSFLVPSAYQSHVIVKSAFFFPKPLPDSLSRRGFLTRTELLGLLLAIFIICRQLLDYKVFLILYTDRMPNSQYTFEQMFLLINRVWELSAL